MRSSCAWVDGQTGQSRQPRWPAAIADPQDWPESGSPRWTFRERGIARPSSKAGKTSRSAASRVPGVSARWSKRLDSSPRAVVRAAVETTEQFERACLEDAYFDLAEFNARFPDDQACLDHLWRERFSPDGSRAFCCRCARDRKFRRYEGRVARHAWTCTACGTYIYPTAGTIFQKSSTSLRTWFYVVYLLAATNFDLSVKDLQRDTGVTYKTAWRMSHLITRQLLESEDTLPVGALESEGPPHLMLTERGSPTRKAS